MITMNRKGILGVAMGSSEAVGYVDPKGAKRDLGYWTCEDMHISRDTTGMEIITTCYVAQQLMVYYRYLPTSSREAWNAEEEKPATPVETGDVAVDLGDL